MSVLVVSKILRPFVNALTADDKCSLDKRELLKKAIQIQLSKELKTFSIFFVAVPKSLLNFEHLLKKDEPHSLCIFEMIDAERRAYVNV